MSWSCQVNRIVVDLRANALVLHVVPPLPAADWTVATIDIGTSGRLLGVDLEPGWLEIAGGDSRHLRSADVPIAVSDDRTTIRLPRRGDGWEISFPSGNQCWRLDDGRTICSETGSA